MSRIGEAPDGVRKGGDMLAVADRMLVNARRHEQFAVPLVERNLLLRPICLRGIHQTQAFHAISIASHRIRQLVDLGTQFRIAPQRLNFLSSTASTSFLSSGYIRATANLRANASSSRVSQIALACTSSGWES